MKIATNFACLGFTFAVDCGLAAILCISTPGASADVAVVMLISRVALVVLLGLTAVTLGNGSCPGTQERAADSARVGGDARSLGSTGHRPLLTVPEDLSMVDASTGSEPAPESNDERIARINNAIDAESAKLANSGPRLNRCYFVVGVLYCSLVLSMVAAAMHLVQLDHDTEGLEVCIYTFVGSILLTQLEIYLSKALIIACTAPETVTLSAFHEHPLRWAKAKGYCVCSVCNQKVGDNTGGFMALQCTKCIAGMYGHGGYSICSNCYKKYQTKISGSEEKGTPMKAGILYTDKGYQDQEPMTVGGFIIRMLGFIKPFALTVIIALGCISVSQVISTYMSKLSGQVLNDLAAGSSDAFYRDMNSYVVYTVVAILVGTVQSYAIAMTMTRLYNHMAKRLYSSLINQDMAFYDNAMSGQLTSRLSSDLGSATFPIPNLINSLFANLIGLISGFYFAVDTSWRLTLLAFVILSPVIYVTKVYSEFAGQLQAQAFSYLADANAAANQALGNIRTVKFSGAVAVEESKYNGLLDQQMSNGQTGALAGMGNALTTTFLSRGSSFLVLFYGGRLVLSGSGGLEAGSIFTFTLLWGQVSGAFQGLMNSINDPIKAMSAATRVFEIIDLIPAIKDDPNGATVGEGESVRLEFKDVHFHYFSRPHVPVFKGLSFVIEEGKTTAFVGRSGCGKSTLTRLLLRFYDPRDGEILINNRPHTELCLTKYRQSIGIVSQETQLFKMSIRDNLTYGLEKEDSNGCAIDYAQSPYKERLERAAELAKADAFIKELNEGYSTICGENAQDFSGGQRQRVSIARALLRKPRLLLLDEATSALDAESEAMVQTSLNTVMEEMHGTCTIVSIAHRLATIAGADRICMMLNEDKKGALVVESGTHDDLIKLDGEYKKLVQHQLVKDNTSDEGSSKKAIPREVYSSIVDELPVKSDIVLIGHNLYSLDQHNDDKVVILHEGEVVEKGKHAELIEDEHSRYARMMARLQLEYPKATHDSHLFKEAMTGLGNTPDGTPLRAQLVSKSVEFFPSHETPAMVKLRRMASGAPGRNRSGSENRGPPPLSFLNRATSAPS